MATCILVTVELQGYFDMLLTTSLFFRFTRRSLSSVTMANMPGMPTAAPSSRVELHIRCKDLLNKDVTSKSDPCAVFYMQEGGRWYEVCTFRRVDAGMRYVELYERIMKYNWVNRKCTLCLLFELTAQLSDCRIEVFLYLQAGRTENIKNTLSPQFAKAFEVDYYFEEVQKIRVAVYDIDNKTPDLSDDDFLGEIECTMGQVCLSVCLFSTLKWRKNSDGIS